MEPQGLWEQAERLRGAADEATRLAQNGPTGGNVR
jgi:hypothetical protein